MILALLGCGAPGTAELPPWECDPRTMAAGEVRVRVVPCTDELLEEGDAYRGDWVLESSVARFFVRTLPSLTQVGRAGGTIVDAAPAGGVDTVEELIPELDGGWFTAIDAIRGGRRLAHRGGPVRRRNGGARDLSTGSRQSVARDRCAVGARGSARGSRRDRRHDRAPGRGRRGARRNGAARGPRRMGAARGSDCRRDARRRDRGAVRRCDRSGRRVGRHLDRRRARRRSGRPHPDHRRCLRGARAGREHPACGGRRARGQRRSRGGVGRRSVHRALRARWH